MNKVRHSLWLFFGGRKRLEQTLRRAAMHNDDASVVLTLIDMGARPDAKDPQTGRTPLMIAVDNGCRGVIVALLSHGADIHTRANNGKSVLDLAREKGQSEIVDLLERAHQANQEYLPGRTGSGAK